MNIDWDATGSMLQGLGSVGGTVAIFYAAWKGAQTYGNWKNQKIAERRQDQAERILIAKHRVRDVFNHVRSGVIWGHELNAAEIKLKENAELWAMQPQPKRRRLVKGQVLLDRLARHENVRLEILACIPFARAYFGTDLEQGLENLHHQFWIVQVDIESYIDDDGSDADFSRRLLIGIGDRRAKEGEADETGEAIRSACETIERICNPAIMLET